MLALYIILGILLFLFILLALLLFLDFSVILSTDGKIISVKIKILGITIKIPLSPKEKQKEKPKKETKKPETEETVMQKFLNLRNNFARQKNAIELAVIYLRKRINIEDFGITGEFGTGNAASTGIAYGAVSAFVNTVFGFLGQFFVIKKPPVTALELSYDKAVFNLKFAFMIKTKLWHLLKAFLIYKNNIK